MVGIYDLELKIHSNVFNSYMYDTGLIVCTQLLGLNWMKPCDCLHTLLYPVVEFVCTRTVYCMANLSIYSSNACNSESTIA